MNKEQFLYLIEHSIQCLEAINSVDYDYQKGKLLELNNLFYELKNSWEDLLAQNEILQIGIVGQVNTGKSSFLNSLFFNGEDVLPKASTPMTAGLTVLEFAEENTFEVEYFNEIDWDVFVKQNAEYERIEKDVRNDPNYRGAPEVVINKEIRRNIPAVVQAAHEMVSSCTSKARGKIGHGKDGQAFGSIAELKNVLHQYVGAKGELTSVVKCLYIKMNDNRLKGLRIVDTPGVNDPVVSRENRTRMFLHTCHGVFLLSSSSAFLSSCDVNFLNSRVGSSGIGTVVLVASKFDSVLQNLGAGFMMKNIPVPSIDVLKKEQVQRFAQRFKDLKSTIDSNICNRIKLTASAGIGFSIAVKDANQWDAIEKQVVAQMKRFFPDDFTEDKFRSSFKALANIENIRTTCLEDFFVKRKTAIIEEKLNGFWEQNKKELLDVISKLKEEYQFRYEQLTRTTIAEINRQKEKHNDIAENLQHAFVSKSQLFINSLQEKVRTEIPNQITFDTIYQIPEEKTETEVRCKGWLFGHNIEKVEHATVDTFKLEKLFKIAVEKYANAWNVAWKRLMEAEKNILAGSLIEAITIADKKAMSPNFKDKYYRRLIDDTLQEIDNYRELKIGDLIDRYQKAGSIKAQRCQYIPIGTDELKYSQLSQYLKCQLHEHNYGEGGVKKAFFGLEDSLKADVEVAVNQNIKGTDDGNIRGIEKVVDEMKANFAGNFAHESEEYLNNLENEFANQTENLHKMEEIIKNLTQLSVVISGNK